MVMLVLGPKIEEKEPSNLPKGKGRGISTFTWRNKSKYGRREELQLLQDSL